MYHLRLKIFIGVCLCGLLITVGRMLTMQVFDVETTRQHLADQQIRSPELQPTIRGRILDRFNRPLAEDKPTFYLQIGYTLTKYHDPRWREGAIRIRMARARGEQTREEVEKKAYEDWADEIGQLNKAIDLANVLADVSESDILNEINQINDQVWSLARFIVWRNKNPEKKWSQYEAECDTIEPEKIVLADIREMKFGTYPLIELTTEEDLLQAQVALLDLKDLQIKPMAKRDYPRGSAACQLIGWVAPAREAEWLPFEDAEYLRKYQTGDVIGKTGLERIYEPLLRGRRGEIQKDIEGNIVKRIEPQYGKDIKLTLDIDLQKAVEDMLADPVRNLSAHKNCAAVVLEPATNDILAIAATPVYDLNTIRLASNYDRVFNDPNYMQFGHRALEANYPPGSTAKPLVLIAGLETKKVGPDEPISCSYNIAEGFPRCLAQYRYGPPHDIQWTNNGRNAIRGSCNAYFSHLADRIDRADLQEWFFNFGYGQKILPTPMPDDLPLAGPFKREIKQAWGNLSSNVQKFPFTDSWDLPLIKNSDKRFWGIGQGTLEATVLQVANALSAIVRNGVYKAPRLVYDEQDPTNDKFRRQIPVSRQTLAEVRDGMYDVVNESGGTANRVFYKDKTGKRKKSELFDRGLKIYGKTGSTEGKVVAWFECFAEDRTGRSIVIVTLVEGGESGAGEAAPLGHEILRICNRAGYIGTQPTAEQTKPNNQ